MALDDVDLRLVEKTSDAADLMTWLGERRPVLAVDTETGGLDFWREPLRLVQVGDAKTGWSIPFLEWRGLVEEVLSEYDGEIVMHNAMFDVGFLEHHAAVEFDWSKMHDTMILSHILRPDARHGLKGLSVQHVDASAGVGETILHKAMADSGWTWATVPTNFKPYWAYGALDTVITAQLWEVFHPRVMAFAPAAYDLEMGALSVCERMSRRGSRIDLAYCAAKGQALSTFVAQTNDWCQRTYGFGPGQNSRVADQLLADGVMLTKKTAKGAWCLDAEVLESLEGQHQLTDAVLRARKAQKVVSTYFTNFIDMADGDVLHCKIRTTGARTGRMSIATPALQTLPREDPLVRDAFVPRDGHRLASIDYSGVEMRLAAHFAGETAMIEAIKNGVDIHTYAAQLAFGLGDQEPTKSQRSIAKSAGFAKLYGAGVPKFSHTAGISASEGAAFMQSYDAAFPRLRAYGSTIEREARQRSAQTGTPSISNDSGRWHPTDDDLIYKLFNYKIQGEAAEVLKRALVRLEQAGFGDHMLLPVHDEIIFEFPEDDAVEMMAAAKEIMEERERFTVPLECEAEGPLERWGEKYR